MVIASISFSSREIWTIIEKGVHDTERPPQLAPASQKHFHTDAGGIAIALHVLRAGELKMRDPPSKWGSVGSYGIVEKCQGGCHGCVVQH